jgi:ferritin-like metal-binding protein YciE
MAEASAEVVRRYLQDAIAAEESFETQFERFAGQSGSPEIDRIYRSHASEIKNHRKKLAARLDGLGGSIATTRGLLTHFLRLTPKIMQHRHATSAARVQNAVLAFAIENSEVALYEILANVAEAAGDTETASLTRSIQQEKKTSVAQIWKLLPETATSR